MNFIKYAYTLLLLTTAFNISAYTSVNNNSFLQFHNDTVLVVPLGGNTWIDNKSNDEKVITNDGITHWKDANTVFNTYVRINKAGTFLLKVNAKTKGKSKLTIAIGKQKKAIIIADDEYKLYNAGSWKLNDTGYIKISLTASEKSGEYFADIKAYEISGSAISNKTAFVKDNEGNFFYWGRRGPSVHLNYPFADSIQAEWFYNEVTVPEGNDVTGSYFMADGFGEGYFGMQVNSATERRILFSVWSPFSTDDPKDIPDSMRIVMLKKGEAVHAGEFGNEGSGGQSYMRYNWKAGNAYKFLLKGQPIDYRT